MKVLIAHAKGEEDKAEKLAAPIRAAGYDVAHEGTVLVGNSVIAEASKLLAEGTPVIFCGTVRAMGTKWAKQVANAARSHAGVRLFVVRMEEEADVETLSFDEYIAQYWQDSKKAELDLIAALKKFYPLDTDARQILQHNDLESRYRALTLKACDIIDLANLPQDDRHLATRELELRRLYVSLRMRLEPDQKSKNIEEARLKRKWGGDPSEKADNEGRVSLGERLMEARRLVVLGDPGAGKSTLLRWLTTAFLLRLKNDPDWRDLPDIATLPDATWLPVLVRCRDLPPGAATLDDMLYHALRKIELVEHECNALCNLLREKLQEGTALLLVDGLDEITEPAARVRFSQQLARIHRVYPNAPMVVTSRIVGYREMGYRIKEGFEHLTVADLSKHDKDDFARRWCNLTERGERRETAAEDLIRDIHSSDRIERLTGNPMLLTTMALIKRKIGKLPQRRVDLYEKTVEVLLNWRSEVDIALDPREALPQLRYVAYAMCDRGIQQIREDDALGMLRRARDEYPQIHPMGQHSPEDFLTLLERRTGLLIQSGHTRHNGETVPVYEFRHLTIQEYLAGVALVQGHFPSRDRQKSIAQNVAPLAGQVGESDDKGDSTVTENWREALRLCVAACNDDDVDSVLRAILTPLSGEADTARPRAGLAALCLADEPNVSEYVAHEVLLAFASNVGNDDGFRFGITSYDIAAMELSRSRWRDSLLAFLATEYLRRELPPASSVGGILGFVGETAAPKEAAPFKKWLRDQAHILNSDDKISAVRVILGMMVLAFNKRKCDTPEIVFGLLAKINSGIHFTYSVMWALMWFAENLNWKPSPVELNTLISIARNPECGSETAFFICKTFEYIQSAETIDVLLVLIRNPSVATRISAVEALGRIGGARAIDGLLLCIKDRNEDTNVRKAAVRAIGRSGGKKELHTLTELLNKDDDDIRRAVVAEISKK